MQRGGDFALACPWRLQPGAELQLCTLETHSAVPSLKLQEAPAPSALGSEARELEMSIWRELQGRARLRSCGQLEIEGRPWPITAPEVAWARGKTRRKYQKVSNRVLDGLVLLCLRLEMLVSGLGVSQ